jgi:hypothetical protein
MIDFYNTYIMGLSQKCRIFILGRDISGDFKLFMKNPPARKLAFPICQRGIKGDIVLKIFYGVNSFEMQKLPL